MKRFWDKVNKTENCWWWTASSRGGGYGSFKYERKVIDAHRFCWFLIYNKWPENWILHTCNNRLCVNPKHLYEGTPKQNYEDMRISGNVPERKNKIYSSAKEQKRAAWKRWYQKVKNEKGRIKYNRWRNTQKVKKNHML